MARRSLADKNDSAMRPGFELADVGEVEILRYQHAANMLCRLPGGVVVFRRQILINDGVDIVSEVGEHAYERMGQVLVEFDVHARTGTAGTG